MEICSLIKLSKGRTRICLDNGTDFVLYRGEFGKLDITEGGNISQEDYDKLLGEILIPRCKKRAMYLLQKQDRSEKNLRDKLAEGFYPPEAIDAAIAYVDSFGYIDERRMAGSYIRFYQDSRSRQRIRQDLINKGISGDVIDECLEEEYTSDESALIDALLQKKGYDPDTASYQDRCKLYRFLAGRGFSSDSINKALRD